MKKILLINNSPLIENGLKIILEKRDDLSLIASYLDVSHLAEHIQSSRPDVLLINPTLLNRDEYANVRDCFSVSDKTALIALVYAFIEPSILSQFDACISLSDAPSKILSILANTDNQNVANMDSNTSSNGLDNEPLSDREKEILIAVAKGLTNKEIADKFFISIHTVISHRKNIVKKTGIKTVSGLTAFALVNNLLTLDEIE